MGALLTIRELWGTWWRAALGFAVATALCLPLGYCEGKRAGKAKADAAAAVATVEVMKVDGNAKDVAAIERTKDDAAVVEQKEKLTDAVANLPDSLPSPRRVALACERLRQQGTDTSRLPACGGSPDGGQAATPAGGPR